MKTIEYIYSNKGIITHLHVGVSGYSKIGIGYVLQTYHYSVEQLHNDEKKAKESFRNDNLNCLDCPLKFDEITGISGGCYTHNGMIYNGLISKLKKTIRLNKKGLIKPFENKAFFEFIEKVKKQTKKTPLDLIRFGAYGEPIHLGKFVAMAISNLCIKSTGYSHQWNKPVYNWAKEIFMASSHTEKDLHNAKELGFRSFFVKAKGQSTEKSTLCPASKESDKNKTCITCGLCNGNKTGIKNDVHIDMHK